MTLNERVQLKKPKCLPHTYYSNGVAIYQKHRCFTMTMDRLVFFFADLQKNDWRVVEKFEVIDEVWFYTVMGNRILKDFPKEWLESYVEKNEYEIE